MHLLAVCLLVTAAWDIASWRAHWAIFYCYSVRDSVCWALWVIHLLGWSVYVLDCRMVIGLFDHDEDYSICLTDVSLTWNVCDFLVGLELTQCCPARCSSDSRACTLSWPAQFKFPSEWPLLRCSSLAVDQTHCTSLILSQFYRLSIVFITTPLPRFGTLFCPVCWSVSFRFLLFTLLSNCCSSVW